jgi:hypothetical protein
MDALDLLASAAMRRIATPTPTPTPTAPRRRTSMRFRSNLNKERAPKLCNTGDCTYACESGTLCCSRCTLLRTATAPTDITRIGQDVEILWCCVRHVPGAKEAGRPGVDDAEFIPATVVGIDMATPGRGVRVRGNDWARKDSAWVPLCKVRLPATTTSGVGAKRTSSAAFAEADVPVAKRRRSAAQPCRTVTLSANLSAPAKALHERFLATSSQYCSTCTKADKRTYEIVSDALDAARENEAPDMAVEMAFHGTGEKDPIEIMESDNVLGTMGFSKVGRRRYGNGFYASRGARLANGHAHRVPPAACARYNVAGQWSTVIVGGNINLPDGETLAATTAESHDYSRECSVVRVDNSPYSCRLGRAATDTVFCAYKNGIFNARTIHTMVLTATNLPCAACTAKFETDEWITVARTTAVSMIQMFVQPWMPCATLCDQRLGILKAQTFAHRLAHRHTTIGTVAGPKSIFMKKVAASIDRIAAMAAAAATAAVPQTRPYAVSELARL